jgi:hypothetical protein
VAHRDARLAAGDRLLEVNGQTCLDRTHDVSPQPSLGPRPHLICTPSPQPPLPLYPLLPSLPSHDTHLTQQLVVGYLKMVHIGQPVRLRIDKHAFTRNSNMLARSLGFDEAPKPRVRPAIRLPSMHFIFQSTFFALSLSLFLRLIGLVC